ncbi:MAG: amidase [Actinomycetota bacterium]|nr:amidase [Actinomycetota bacterium]
MGDALWERSALELAGSIRKGEVSSREVVEAHLARIEAVNPRLNAVTLVLADEALAAADDVDAGRGAEGPLRGVPVTVKENIDCAGTATTNGVPALAEAVAPLDAPSVERVRAAGAIPIARTNLPEMALRISTDNPLRGLTRNPWHLDLTAGGSSGGEGSAIASGMSPLGLGNDIGGSVRNPAYCCGITSLKPTPGRIPQATVIPPEDPGLAVQMMAVCGPMARHVDDLRIAFELLAGHHPRDPWSVTAPHVGPPAARRAALVTGIDGVDSPPEIADAVRRAGAALADAGWEVTEAEPPELARTHEVWAHVLAFDLMAMLDMVRPIMTEGAVGLLEVLIAGYPVESMPPQLAHVERHRLARAWTAFFAEHPVVVGPTWTLPPFAHGADLDPDTGAEATLDRLRFITPANVLGLPSAALPMGTADGHPTGVQFYADRWREDLCLAAAETVESAVGRITPIDPTWE